MTSDNDKATAQRIVNEANILIEGMSPQAFADLCKTIEAALTTTRKEARAAALREIINAAQTENAPYNAGREYARGFARAKKTIIGNIRSRSPH